MANLTHPKITGILLAAGLSTRMGRPKQLLPFATSTIIETVIDNIVSSNFDDVRVVLGHCSQDIENLIEYFGVQTVFNPGYRDGMLSSAKVGIKSVCLTNTLTHSSEQANDANKDAFSLMLVDQPFITTELINLTIEGYRESNKGITIPSYNFQRGHPVIFNNKYAKEILTLDDDSGGIRSLYKTYSDDINYVNVETDYILKDIDFPDDYTKALKECENRNR
ncbi:nucleotidyltransferase family protein [Candidatus Poribacteria bacterium]|nr:nucleotidyltransferase family protein [Candidatus Poribacteria bacterium]